MSEEAERTFSNVIYVGEKPFPRYIMTLNACLLKGNQEIEIKARGKSASKALDLMQFAMRVHGMKCPLDEDHFKIFSEQVDSKKEQGKKVYVTCVNIKLEKA